MDNKDWYDCGARIGDLVQSAIDSKNYQNLSESIANVINDTTDAVQKSLFGDGKGDSAPGNPSSGEYRAKGTAYGQAKQKVNTADLFDSLTKETDAKGRKKVRNAFRGLASVITGFSLMAFFGIGALAVGLTSRAFSGGSGFLFATVLLTLLAAASGVLGFKGLGERKRMRRAQQYLTIVGDREYCTIEELAAGSGQSVKKVRKDLRKMIADGIFDSAAYMDAGETTFMVTPAAYRQYQDVVKAEKQQQEAAAKQEQARREAEKNMAACSEETRQILQEGRDFIAHIHECNERIPDETMTEKLNVLENVVTRIFRQVEAHPESAPDLHRLMSYYLPITQKLIDAYIELDDEHLTGENVRKTREEIELSLDTVNEAFEAFLDGFFETTAWDISSDISTLKTMMARDGLTGNQDFAGGGRIRTVGDDLSPQSAAALGPARKSPDKPADAFAGGTLTGAAQSTGAAGSIAGTGAAGSIASAGAAGGTAGAAAQQEK